ncbi:hypothetical protein FN846DRAFT_896191 [Sphaerosporella brunnea]|uniref:Uncharacterized protein n=1 Tax=Sphaerosporella brunnea TaxID=1250544 RepID=A0A5J5EDA0_9PEZI|nr:hypothetical protein FN846DRAFT_896191 [Sphaerosporella brunnea]
MLRFLYLPLAATGAYVFLLSPNTLEIFKHITAVQKSGLFPHGEALKKSYTGIWQIDYGLQLLVCFVQQLVDGSNPDAWTLLLNFLMGLLPACIGVWAIEAARKGTPQTAMRSPLTFNQAMQTIGFCTAAPLGFYAHVSTPKPKDASLPAARAASILPALILGFMVPTAAMFLPSTHIATATRQSIIVAGQGGFPLLFYVLQRISAAAASGRAKNERCHVYAVYNFLIAGSLAVHAYTYYYIFAAAAAESPVTRLASVFVPRSNPQALGDRTVWFIQIDFLLGAIAALLWTAMSVWSVMDAAGKSLGKALGLATAVAAAAIVVGPGTVVAAGFRWREAQLRSEVEKVKKVAVVEEKR